MRIPLSIFSLLIFFACQSRAQSASSYYVAYDSGGIMDASLTMQNGNMGTCNHVFTDSLDLFGPGGLVGNDNFNNNTYSATSAFTMTWNTKLAVGPDGPYQVTTASSAYCDCIDEEFYNNGGEQDTVYPVPAIQYLQNLNYQPFQPYVDTPASAGQYMLIWGIDLTAGGASDPPYISVNGVGSTGDSEISVTGFHLGTGWYVGETDESGASQINIPYWVDANATPGTYTLALETLGGVTSIDFTVGDASPVITSISSSSYSVGARQSVTITGSHFGTNCPNIQFPFSLQSGYTASNCSDGSVTVSFTPSGTGSGSLSLYAEGYNGSGEGFAPQKPGEPQSATTTVSAIFAPAPVLTESNPLWFFGIGNTPPPSFTLGNIQTTISAQGASGSYFSWSITSSSGAASFANGTSQLATTTSSNSVVVYSLSYGITMNDTAITLNWIDANGAIHLPGTLAVTIDSPYRLVSTNAVPAYAVANCNQPPQTANPIGWYSTYTWAMYSKFGAQLAGQSLNENFTNVQNYNNTNWTFTPNGLPGKSGFYQFTDIYCVADQAPWRPSTTVPQDPLTTSIVDSITETYSIGTANVGGGVPVQTQTLSRYVDHPSVTSIVSPVRSQ